MAITQDQVVEYISNLKLGEVKRLVETLEEVLGVKASAPVAAVAAVGPAVAAEPEEEQTEFNVILKDFGPKKIDVIKVVREITGLGLKDAKALVEGAPSTVKEAVDKEAALKIKKSLEEVGAAVDLK